MQVPSQWLELLCKHLPDRQEHLVRYVGWYSNRARGERAKVLEAQQPATAAPAAEAALSEFASRAKARLNFLSFEERIGALPQRAPAPQW